MSNNVGHHEKICETEYFTQILLNRDVSNSYEIKSRNSTPIIPISDCTSSQYPSIYSSGFGDMDTTSSFVSLPLAYNSDFYGNWSFDNESINSNLNNSDYCNYNQEIFNNYNTYSSFNNQIYTYNNTLNNNYSDVPLTYFTEVYENKLQTFSYQTTDFDSCQVIESNSEYITEYHSQEQQMEGILNCDQICNTHQWQINKKTETVNKNSDTIKSSYDYIYSPEMVEILEFFHHNKKSIFENTMLHNSNIINNSLTSDISIKIPEKIKNESKSLQEREVKYELDGKYSSNDISNQCIIFDLNVSKKFHNGMIVENIEVFATNFKNQRISYGFTQGDVGRHIGLRFGNEFSQTTISRFEALNLSCKNMLKLKPKLEEWLVSTQQLFQQGYTALEINENNLHNKFPRVAIIEQEEKQMVEIKKVKKQFCNDISKKRRKRTNLELEQKNILYKKYLENNRPTEDVIKKLASDIDLDISVVKIWFCNRRQKEKKSLKRNI